MILPYTASYLFFFNDTATTEIYTLFPTRRSSDLTRLATGWNEVRRALFTPGRAAARSHLRSAPRGAVPARSEEHTSELQSQSNLVCRLLLEKKKKNRSQNHQHDTVASHCSLPATP